MPDDSIRLDERVDDVYPFGIPLINQPVEKVNQLREKVSQLGVYVDEGSASEARAGARMVAELTLSTIQRELIGTAHSIRADGEPKTVLHALLLEDDLTLGRIAGTIHQDPRDLAFQLEALCDLGWVRRQGGDGPERYSLVGW
jgi:hypothetical protein